MDFNARKRTAVLISAFCFLFINCDSVNVQLTNRYNELLQNINMEWMIVDLLQRTMIDINCSLILLDEYYQQIVGNVFNRPENSSPYFKILVNESEDLLSPNYNTFKVIEQAKKNSCNLYVILLANGDQIARFLIFGDRHRAIDSRAKFILIKDRRLFYQKYNVIWRKIVNVLFVKQYKNTSRYEISTVAFPPPLNGLIIPYKVNSWDNGFQKNRNLFQDKISNLQGQTLKVATFEHMPTTAIVFPNNHSTNQEDNVPIYTGLEIEVLKTLSGAMNFHYTIYEPPNANEEQWGRKQTNGSFSGLLGEMLSGKADIALGNLYYTPYHLQTLDLSIPYNTECLTFLTPEQLTDNSWKTLILPFQGNMWRAVLITLLLGGFLFYFLAFYHRYVEDHDYLLSQRSARTESDLGDQNATKMSQLFDRRLKQIRKCLKLKWRKMNKKKIFFKKHRTAYARKRPFMLDDLRSSSSSPFRFATTSEEKTDRKGLYIFERLDNSILYTYGMFLFVSLPKIPSGWAIRMFIGWWWLYCILVSVAYKASLTAILANPAPRVTIDTLEQLAESKVGCGGWGEQSKEFFVTSLDVASQKVGRKFEITYDVDSAVERVASGDFAYYENVYFLHYLTVKHKDVNVLSRYNDTENENIDKTKGKILHIMTNCVINMPISVGLQKNSPLKPKIDNYLLRVVEAGLVEKWLADVMFKVTTTQAKRETEGMKALMNLSKLYSAVVALFVGYVLSVMIFCSEIIMWYCVEKRNPNFDKYNLREYYARKKKN